MKSAACWHSCSCSSNGDASDAANATATVTVIVTVNLTASGHASGDVSGDGCVYDRRTRLFSGSPVAQSETATAVEPEAQAAGIHIVAKVVMVGKGMPVVVGHELCAAYTVVALLEYSLD